MNSDVHWRLNLYYEPEFVYCFLLAPQPPVGQGLLIHEVSRSHTMTHHTRQDSSGRVISSTQRPLPNNKQHSRQTDIYAPGGILTHILSRRAATDLRLRPRGHWYRHEPTLDTIQHSQETDVHGPDGIWAHNRSKREPAATGIGIIYNMVQL